MIQDLERHLRACWHLVEPNSRVPSRFHFLKLASEEYPDAGVPLLLFAFTPAGRAPRAVAKVARAPEGDAAVEAEAAFLARLHSRLPAALSPPVPRLLQQGSTHGRAFLLMSAVPGEVELHNTWGVERARLAAARIGAALDWAWNVAAATAAAPLTWRAWIGEESVSAFLADAAVGDWDAVRRAELERRLQAASDSPWPTGVAHGDFFPGNVLFQRSRLSGVVDWSMGAEQVPFFFDVLTYETSFALQAAQCGPDLHAGTLRRVHDLAPFVALRRRFEAAGIDVGPGSPARLVTLLALHRTARRHGRDAVAGAMARILAAALEV